MLVGGISAWGQSVWSLGLVGVISGWGHWMWSLGMVTGWWICCLPHNEVSVLFGSLVPTSCSVFVNCFSLFILSLQPYRVSILLQMSTSQSVSLQPYFVSIHLKYQTFINTFFQNVFIYLFPYFYGGTDMLKINFPIFNIYVRTCTSMISLGGSSRWENLKSDASLFVTKYVHVLYV